MTISLTFAGPTATDAALSADDTGRTLAGLAVPYGVASNPSQDGHRYRFAGGPANGDDLVDVVEEHDPAALVGRLSEPWTDTDAGLVASIRVFASSRGNDVLVEYAEGARTGFSVGASIARFSVAADGVRDVAAGDWTAAHLGVVRRPAFPSARITVHASEGAPTMPDTPTPPPAAPAVEQLPTVAELAAKVAAHLSSDQPAPSTLGQFATFDEFVVAFAAADGDARDELQAAFAVGEQITTNNPGVMPNVWRSEIKMNLDARRPAINAFGTVPLPSAGMDSTWPYFDGSLDTIIKEQATELAELEGVRIDIKKQTEPIKTAGTISNLSYQLLYRSNPSYLAAYLRICLAAWARYNERQFETALLARGTNAGVLPSLANAKAVRSALFAASADAEDATGAPADVVLVDRATFITLGGVEDLYNSKYGTQNAAGTASASSLQIDVNGLTVKRAPFFPAATMLVGSSQAAKYAESGPQLATEEDVSKLGRQVAVWGMYEDAEVYFPAGLRVYKPAP